MTFESRTIVENEPFTGLTEDDSRFLQRRLGGRLQLRPKGWVISRYVGHIVTPGGTALRLVSSKASVADLLAWLAYVDPSLRLLQADAVQAGLSGAGDLATLLARLFLRELLVTIERYGLTMKYRRTTTRGAAVRGPIDFQRLIADGHDLTRIQCAIWTRAPDTALNRTLSAAIRRISVDPVLRMAAGEQLTIAQRHFHQVPTTGVEASLQRGYPLARTEEPYRTAYEFARLVLRTGGLGDGATHRGFAFLVDLERLFESAVQRAFGDAPSIVSCDRQARVYYTRRTAHNAERVAMFIDVLCRTTDHVVVVDAKFKHDINSANIQQMLAYCYMIGARCGALVLPGKARDDSEVEIAPLSAALNPPLHIRIVHFDVSQSTLSGWHRAATDLVRRTLNP